MNWPMLMILALAAGRATHLVTDDMFPFGWLRNRLDRSRNKVAQYAGYGLNCTFCVSIWAGFAAMLVSTGMGWAPPLEWSWRGAGLGLTLTFAFANAIVLLEGLVFSVMDD